MFALAVKDLCGEATDLYGRRKKRQAQTEALERVEDDGLWIGSFVWVCDHLGLDVQTVRAALRRAVRGLGQDHGLVLW